MASQQERRVPARPPPPRHLTPSSSQSTSPFSSASSTQAPIQTFKDLQRVHDVAYRHVDAGLFADESGDPCTAFDSYTQGLQLLNKALRVNCEQLHQCSTDQIDQAKELQMKMNKTKQQITFRLQSLQADQGSTLSQQEQEMEILEATAPPSYEEAMSEPGSPPSYEDDELAVLGESLMRREISNSHFSSGANLFSIADGVQIFFITPEGYVSAPSYPTSLHIIMLEDEPQTRGPNGELAPAFLHVGDWVYPLIPGTSPALHTDYGAYIFPDTMSGQPGSAVGLIVPDTMSSEDRMTFEDLLRSFTVLQEQPPALQPAATAPPQEDMDTELKSMEKRQREEKEQQEGPTDMATKISKGILVAADFIAWGVGKGAEKAGELISKGSKKIREKSKPSAEPRKVDPNIQKGVIYARQATDGAVKVTGYIVNKLGEATVALARQIAPHLRKHGTKVIPKSLRKEGPSGKSNVDGVIEVAASGLKGFSTVYLGLERAAKTLGKSLADETVHVVTHKYGEEAGRFTENTMYTAGNVVMTAHNANHLGAKAIAKRAAKETGRAVLDDFNTVRVQKQCGDSSVNGDLNKDTSVDSSEGRSHSDAAAGPSDCAHRK